MKKLNILIAALLVSTATLTQNVGINSTGATPNASAMLDIVSTNKGFLMPRVTLTGTTDITTVTSAANWLTVFNTATVSDVTPGMYYWDGTKWVRIMSSTNAWNTLGNWNTTAATNFLGTLDANNLRFRTNNVERFEMNQSGQLLSIGLGTVSLPTYSFQNDPDIGMWSPGANTLAFSTGALERMRILSTGEVIVGATSTVIADDLFSAVGNATLDWAVNGYTSFNAAGVYGRIMAGTTIYAGVQGEYGGTGDAPGVRGINLTAGAGTDFGDSRDGVVGTSYETGQYRFGVYGLGGLSKRSGGVMGLQPLASGALGYYSNSTTDYSVYGFGNAYETGVSGGIVQNPNGGNNLPTNIYLKTNMNNWVGMENNSQVGLGAHGGVMGGWIKGLVYGAHFSGDLYGSYSNGKVITNDVVVTLNNVGEENRIPTYGINSTSVDVYSKGKNAIENGFKLVEFDENFKKLIALNEEVIVTVSPLGDCKGLYVKNITATGFEVKEMQAGNSNVQFTWIAIGTRTGFEVVNVSPEIVSSSFDENMNGIMFNDADKDSEPKSIWWDGTQVRFDAMPQRIPNQEFIDKNNKTKKQF